MQARGWVEYLEKEILFHLRHHFRKDALDAWNEIAVRWGNTAEIIKDRSAKLLIPTDAQGAGTIREIWTVPFNGTRLTLWNRLPKPEGFEAAPSIEAPLWFVHPDGRHMPAFDLYGNLISLLSLAEEIATEARDRHGRVLGSMSPRDTRNLLEVPAFNEAVAALVGSALAFRGTEAKRWDSIAAVVRPPGMVLSHDVDLLRGDDRITQGVRAYRFLKPLLRAQPPDWRAGKAIFVNAALPYRFYFDKIPDLVEIERAAGARSSFYFLNGAGGRFGARSGPADIRRARDLIPSEWNVGIHYNYDTLLDGVRFEKQRLELEEILGARVLGGRAHYLRFEPRASFHFLESHGIMYDETLGYPDRIGFRCGVAGAYHPPAVEPGESTRMVEVPLVMMDGTLDAQYPRQGQRVLTRLLDHLRKIGGSLSVLVHPGVCDNPEFGEESWPYPDLLRAASELGVRFLLPTHFLGS